MLRGRAAAAGIACLLWGCSGAGDDDSLLNAATECGVAEVAGPAGCEPAGLPITPCGPGEREVATGCQPAGVPPERCPPGFTAQDFGCYPILPEAPCNSSEVALPGETACRALVSCGTGRYGDIPVRADTEHVDASYQGVSQNGDPEMPWTSIQAAVNAAPSGAMIAVAPGSYAESVHVAGKTLQIWGKCPQEVEIVGSETAIAGIDFLTGASGSELHNIAVRGGNAGVGVSGAQDVLLENIWVHDTGEVGIVAEAGLGPTSLRLQSSLIERTMPLGVVATGVVIDVDSSVVRDIASFTDGYFGPGIVVQGPEFADYPSTGHITNTVVERARESGIVVAGSSADIERVVVRDTQPNDNGEFGNGVAFFLAKNGAGSSGSLIESTIEGSHDAGVVITTSQVTVDAITVHETLPSPADGAGVGLIIESSTPVRAWAHVTDSLIDASTEVGLFVAASDALIEGVRVRGIAPSEAGLYGWGIVVQDHLMSAQRASAQVRFSAIEACREVGIFVGGSEAIVVATAVRHVVPAVSGQWGIGVSVQANPYNHTTASASIIASLIEHVGSTGVLVRSGSAHVERTLIRDIRGDGAGLNGDGVSVVGEFESASLGLFGSRIENGIRAGLSCFGASASLATNAFVCHSFDLEGESLAAREHRFENLGNNGCGCTEPTGPCKAISSGLSPPEPLDPYEQ